LPDPNLRFHWVVGAAAAFSTSLENIFKRKIRPGLSIFLAQNRHTSGGWEMTTDDMVVDARQAFWGKVTVNWVSSDQCKTFFSGKLRTQTFPQPVSAGVAIAA